MAFTMAGFHHTVITNLMHTRAHSRLTLSNVLGFLIIIKRKLKRNLKKKINQMGHGA